MHAIDALRWFELSLGWAGCLGLCWALVQVGSSRRYCEDEAVELPSTVPVKVRKASRARLVVLGR